MPRRRYRKYDDKTLHTVVIILLLIFLMPFVGIKLLGSKSIAMKILGCILMVVGVIIWIKLAVG